MQCPGISGCNVITECQIVIHYCLLKKGTTWLYHYSDISITAQHWISHTRNLHHDEVTVNNAYFELLSSSVSLLWLCHNRNNLNRYCVSAWQVHHKLRQGLERPEGSEELEKDEESESAEKEERPNKDEGDGALHDSAFAIARSARRTDRRGNGRPSIKCNQGDVREGCGIAGPWELRKEPCRGRDVVFTTLHLLPRSEGEQCRPTVSTLPQILTAQRAHGRVSVSAEDRKVSVNVVITKNKSKWSSLVLMCFPWAGV